MSHEKDRKLRFVVECLTRPDGTIAEVRFDQVAYSTVKTLADVFRWLRDREVRYTTTGLPEGIRFNCRSPVEKLEAFKDEVLHGRLYERLTTCERKKRYTDYESAAIAQARTLLHNKYVPKDNFRLVPYQCNNCRGFHIGHIPIPVCENTGEQRYEV
ncbi:MAG: hypothetical protein EOP84_02710 [Verrucomicrobiaceae bacterium]|nr:MAG: hypothetical protein EOP84_02710 [Verrucomicrobiaceae bacterium]